MNTFTAVPAIRRVPLKVIDSSRFDEWLDSPIENNEPVPTITKIFVCYERGDGTPVPVQIEVDQINREYREAIPTDEARETMSVQEYIDTWRRVNMSLRRNLLLAVVKNLEPDDANNLAATDDGDGNKLLVELGWVQARVLDADEAADEADTGEVKADNETGNAT